MTGHLRKAAERTVDDLWTAIGRVIDPYAYLADVITRIVAGHSQSQLDDLLPWVYNPAPLKAMA